MYAQIEKKKDKENNDWVIANSVVQKKGTGRQGFEFMHKGNNAGFPNMIQNNLQLNKETVQRARKKINIQKSASFSVLGMPFSRPEYYSFTQASALRATEPMQNGVWRKVTGRRARSGVELGQCCSYGAVQYLEKVNDGLTGDHQPSGAAIKEAIRLKLHPKLNRVLTRDMAKRAYSRAITIVMPDTWHRDKSRTFAGKNTRAQINSDAQDLESAAMKDWAVTVPELLRKNMNKKQIIAVWERLDRLRQQFFRTGNAQGIK